MKILHTADWHLGKSLFGISRLAEQAHALDQLTNIIKQEQVDLLLICGDIFDTFVPKAEAEKLFYSKLLAISSMCKVIALSGNHDDGERLCAPSGLAKLCSIELINDAQSITTLINGERVTIASLAYPFVSRLISTSRGGDNVERVKYLIDQATNGFDSGINIFASHLFIAGSKLSEDRELGTAPLLPKSILPNCDYVALGHIHRTQALDKNAYYSGSLLKYSFDDQYDKHFLIFDTITKSTKQIPISEQRQLLYLSVNSDQEAIHILQSHPNAYVKLDYFGSPLTPIQLKEIKSHPSFAQIVIKNVQTQQIDTQRLNMSPKELFELFYQSKTNKTPDNQTVELFLSLLNEEEECVQND